MWRQLNELLWLGHSFIAVSTKKGPTLAQRVGILKPRLALSGYMFLHSLYFAIDRFAPRDARLNF